MLQEKQAGLNQLRVHDFATGAWREVPFPEPVYAAFAAGTPEFESKRFRYSYQSLITPSSVFDYDTHDGPVAAAEARGGAGRLRPAALRLRAPLGHRARRREGADQHRVPEGPREGRPRAALALRLRLLRLRHAGGVRQPAAEPARSRHPVRDRAHPRRRRDGRGLARRRHADEEEEHLLRLHRLRRVPGRRRSWTSPRAAADRGRQRGRPADGRRRPTSGRTCSAPCTPRCRSST